MADVDVCDEDYDYGEGGERLPLLTAEEARAVVALLGELGDGQQLPGVRWPADELRGRLLRRIPSP